MEFSCVELVGGGVNSNHSIYDDDDDDNDNDHNVNSMVTHISCFASHLAGGACDLKIHGSYSSF